MIHCICNSVNTRLVDEAAAHGGRTPACVMKHCGKRFNCGQCIPSIAERLELVTGEPCAGAVRDLTPVAPALPLAAE